MTSTLKNSGTLLKVIILLLGVSGYTAPASATSAKLYKNPGCNCCDGHADYLRTHDIDVEVIQHDNLNTFKYELGVSADLAGCHTILIDDYIVEGHMPIAVIKHLLTVRPDIRGISLPGMPTGSPGMPGPKKEPFVIYTITDDGTDSEVYSTL